MRQHHWPLSLSLVLLVAANLLANRLLPEADVAIGVGLSLALLVVAHRAGMSLGQIGLERRTAPRGLRWGLAAALVVVAVYLVAGLVPAIRADVTASTATWAQALVTVAVVIPLATAIPEELAFRGVLLALLRRHTNGLWATAVSSALFAVWHLLPSLSGSAANLTVDEAAGAAGVGAAATALRVAGTLLVTFVGGVVLCELRRRSDSLLAPIVAHWAINGVGVLFVLLV